MSAEQPVIVPRPARWPHRADPPGRYWGNYERYQKRGGMIRLEEDIRGLLGDQPSYGDISRFYFFCLAFDQMMKEGVRGDIVELGAYKGATASVLAIMARRMNTTAWILDTFEGFNATDLTGIDAPHQRAESDAMEFSDTSLEAVRTRVGEERTRFIEGYFPESAAQLPDDLSPCLVHIDCDLYQPIIQALNYFYPRLVPGGYLIVHDYASLEWDGAERAVDEFFANKVESVIPLTDGCGSAVIRKSRTPNSGSNWLVNQRCSLFGEAWVGAGNGKLSPLLDGGWSGGEGWGVWGIGSAHILNLYVRVLPASAPIRLEAFVGAAFPAGRTSQAVDVLAGGRVLTTWHFSREANQAVRSVDVPPGVAAVGPDGVSAIRLEFRPHDTRSPNELDPNHKDSRLLGMALHRIRRVPV